MARTKSKGTKERKKSAIFPFFSGNTEAYAKVAPTHIEGGSPTSTLNRVVAESKEVISQQQQRQQSQPPPGPAPGPAPQQPQGQQQSGKLQLKDYQEIAHLLDYLDYQFDRWMSSRRSQSLALVGCGMLILLVSGFLYSIVNSKVATAESIWSAWLLMSDAAAQEIASTQGQRIIAWFVAITGILYFNTIMGVVVDAIREKMDDLKKGKSKVIETGHTLLLGWTDKSVSFIKEICKANESIGGGVIVVLADEEKQVLEADFHSCVKKCDLLNSIVIFRSGNPLVTKDLVRASASTAKVIVILATIGDADRSDAAVLRVVLGLKGLASGLQGHIVAEVRDVDNEPLVRLVGGRDVETIVSHDIVGRLILMSARQPGLARVYNSVLGFDGDEFYVKKWSECTGLQFGELLEYFPDAIVLGIQDQSGKIFLRPSFERRIKDTDELVFIAEDDDSYQVETPVKVCPGIGPDNWEGKKESEKILICGWRRDIRDMLVLLDSLVQIGTEVHIMCERSIEDREHCLADGGLDTSSLINMKIIHHVGNSAVRRHLEALPIPFYTSFMILSDESREKDVMHSDSHSLATLLLLRDVQNIKKRETLLNVFSQKVAKKVALWYPRREATGGCIVEILDPRTQRTIASNREVSLTAEFVQSNEMVSRTLAMVSESRAVNKILNELLGDQGASLKVEPSGKYVCHGEILSFFQVAKRAHSAGKILCGYQVSASLDETILNPKDKNVLRKWHNIDLVLLVRTVRMEQIENVIEAFEDAGKRKLFISAASSPCLVSSPSSPCPP